jgi:hypothetical protein
MSLEPFVVDHRLELIKRTIAQVTTRPSQQSRTAEMDHEVPIFLSQLAAVLRADQRGPAQNGAVSRSDNAYIERRATLHGQNLRKCEFTIDQGRPRS